MFALLKSVALLGFSLSKGYAIGGGGGLKGTPCVAFREMTHRSFPTTFPSTELLRNLPSPKEKPCKITYSNINQNLLVIFTKINRFKNRI